MNYKKAITFYVFGILSVLGLYGAFILTSASGGNRESLQLKDRSEFGAQASDLVELDQYYEAMRMARYLKLRMYTLDSVLEESRSFSTMDFLNKAFENNREVVDLTTWQEPDGAKQIAKLLVAKLHDEQRENVISAGKAISTLFRSSSNESREAINTVLEDSVWIELLNKPDSELLNVAAIALCITGKNSVENFKTLVKTYTRELDGAVSEQEKLGRSLQMKGLIWSIDSFFHGT